MKRLLITDLDNTLYDWVAYFAPSLRAMIHELARLLGEEEGRLYAELQTLHRRYGTSEQPFTVLDLPSVLERFPGTDRRERLELLDGPLHAFNRSRKQTLRLYPGVAETLAACRAAGVAIVGHTESITANAYYRLDRLGLLPYFQRLYTLAGTYEGHPDPERAGELRPPEGFVRTVPAAESKPNPVLLRDLCAREGVSPDDACYVGDSLTRDVTMAKDAGVTAVWARYGTRHDPALWQILLRVTHWTAEDVAREEAIRDSHPEIAPDYTIDAFGELLAVPGFEGVGAGASRARCSAS